MRAFIRVLAASLLLVVVMAGVASSPADAQLGGKGQFTGQMTYTDGTPVVGGSGTDVGRINLFTENRARFLKRGDPNGAGFYGFGALEPGCYVVTAIAPTGDVFVESGGRYLNLPFCLAANETLLGLNAVVALPETLTIEGQMIFPDRSPVEGARVTLFTERRARFLGGADTDSNGEFSFNLPSSGCYVITFIAPDGNTFRTSGGRFLNDAFCTSEDRPAVDRQAILDTGGADAIVGHGSDFLQRFEKIDETAIAFNLGNALTANDEPLRRDSAVLRIQLEEAGDFTCLLPAEGSEFGIVLDDPAGAGCQTS